MNKTIVIALFLTSGLISCKTSEKKIDKLEIVKKYYTVLNNSDYSRTNTWFADSLITKEEEYKKNYSKKEFLEFLKWDSVFEPNYEILEIEQQKDIVKAKISKMDKRIFFLHEKPFLTNQTISFQKDKIISIETVYLNFNYMTWERNKSGLVNWINENHPELNGFINNLTESGGIKFLKAIELYRNKK